MSKDGYQHRANLVDSTRLPSSRNSGNGINEKSHYSDMDEPLIGGFALLRLVQLFNLDIYYIGSSEQQLTEAGEFVTGRPEVCADVEAASQSHQLSKISIANCPQETHKQLQYRTVLDDLADSNFFRKYLIRFPFLAKLCRFLKICLSLIAIVLCFDKTISTVILCSITKIETKGSTATESTNNSVGLLVLILINLSFLHILFSTVFNGHLIWNLFSKRMFLVTRRFQYKTMIILLSLTFIEYLINISFINNLYEWDFTSNNIKSGSYSVLANLRILATDSDVEHYYIDTLLTIFQFARGIIRISPYIIINYAIVCLTEHISAIRGQKLLIDSLKKRQKLRFAIRRRKRATTSNQQLTMNGFASFVDTPSRNEKKKVSFAKSSWKRDSSAQIAMISSSLPIDIAMRAQGNVTNSIQTGAGSVSFKNDLVIRQDSSPSTNYSNQTANETRIEGYPDCGLLLSRVRDFEQLEAYITNLYIFTGQLNRFMSSQGLGTFFIVHNLVISVSVIVPEAIRGGPQMVHLIRALLIVIGIVPFVLGQTLESQLEELSRQIDRIIIQRQFVHCRRDNLIRIRELIHDIKVNCGSMLNFNIETGIKYLVVAFASAFFIEQERK